MDNLDPFNEGLEGKGKYYPMIVLSFKKLLLDDTFADLTIKVGSETVHAHAGIVCCRCEEIIGFPQVDDKKKAAKKKLEVKINPANVANAAIMSKVLEFLYTGMVEFPKMSDTEILHLVGAARFFKLERLSYLCERWLREHMTIESVFHLLKAATDLNEERIKGFCLQFALGHYNEFISNKDGIYILGIELFQEVVAAFQTNPTPPKEFNPETTPDTLLDDFKKLYERMPYSDITFTVRDTPIKCHRAILAAHSDTFVSTLFRDDSGLKTSTTAFNNMLQFLYFGESHVDPLPACELVEFSRRYKLPSLLRICEDKIRTSVALDTVLPILAIAYMPADGKQDLVDELKKKCFPFILENLSKVNLSTIKASNPLLVVDLILELQTAWKSGAYGIGKLPADFSSGIGGNSNNKVKKSKAQPPPPVSNAPEAPTRVVTPSGRREPSAGLLGAQRERTSTTSSSTRGVASSTPSVDNKPPSSLNAPPPPSRTTANVQSNPPPPSLSNDNSSGDEKSKKPMTKKDKKEEEKRKKEEAKRIQKEKKERLKMEKKFKPKGKEIF